MIFTLTLNPAIDKELSVDHLEFGTVLSAQNSRVDPGGKGFNVSRLLKALGTESIAMGFVGGSTGKQLEQSLTDLGIANNLVWIEGETRTNISIVNLEKGNYIKVNEKGPMIDPSSQSELLEKIKANAKEGDWWVLSGSLPPGLEVSFYGRIIELLKGWNANTILDTSGEALVYGCQAGPYLVKPNTTEARELTGQITENIPGLVQAAQEIVNLGPGNVVISKGSDGALLHTNGKSIFARSPKIQQKNPIGAGDAMLGGIVQKLSHGLPLEEAFRYGVACGAAAASLSGTNLGSLQMIETLLPQVEIELIEESTGY